MSFLHWLLSGAIVVVLALSQIISTQDTPMLATSTPTKAVSSTAIETRAPTTTPAAVPAQTTPSSKTPSKPTLPRATQTVVVRAGTTIVEPMLVSQPTQIEFENAAATARGALVNILCTSKDGALKSISGSGVIIDPRGIILTNAHIGQYFLLLEGFPRASCSIRTGSPAKPTYDAKAMFVSPAWIYANPNTLTTADPTGTGEYDFAFLAITGTQTSTPLPSTFPYVPFNWGAPYAGEPIVIASYAAQFLSGDQIISNLAPTVVFGSIKEVFTFKTNTVDVFDLGGTAAAQEGSSGGGVISGTGRLEGIITTSTIEGNTSTRNLSAITTGYVARNFLAQTGVGLDDFLKRSPTESVATFAGEIAALRALILKNL